MQRFGLYVHIPFCPQRCPYCAFTVVTGRQHEVDSYVDRVCAEIAAWSGLRARGGLDTVFLGGGTPSRLTAAQLTRILEAAAGHLGLAVDAEVTIEANPSTAEARHFADLRAAGCNRLSLGVQSLVDDSLLRLGRAHTAADAERAYTVALRAGFASVSIDLIFSVPGADPGDWETTLGRALALSPDHISAYALIIEEGTPFAHQRREGRLPEVPEAEDEAAFLIAVSRLVEAGYEHYEISNFARSGHRCAHNWDCWTGGEYLGVGVSAHSCLDGRRFWNTADIDEYMARIDAGVAACAGEEPADAERARRDRLWLGLRTCAGVELDEAEARHLEASSLWRQLRAHGHAQLQDRRLVLTERGLAIADGVAAAVAEAVVDGALRA